MDDGRRSLAADDARELKEQLTQSLTDVRSRGVQASAAQDAPLLSLGLAPQRDGGFLVAVRYPLGTSTARMLARRAREAIGPQADVRRTGRIRALAGGPLGRARVLPTAQAAGETGRSRPLRPGVSIAHVLVTAGTLGGFVALDDPAATDGAGPGAATHVLSNWHVLVGSTSARAGDPVLQPGPADGGTEPEDRVGVLDRSVPIVAGRRSLVDCATARLDAGIEVDPTYPAGRLTGVAAVRGDEAVEKVGRTTGLTQGRVTAIELDGVAVGYGEDVGTIVLDGQIEIESTGTGPFSRGGDSGSIVYRPEDMAGIGLLFAGSETGGDDGTGLTYVNPLGTVLEQLGARLIT